MEIIDTLTGKSGLYPSRSELIRVAVRDWLISELKDLEAFRKYQQTHMEPILPTKIDGQRYVRVPLDDKPLTDGAYKTYTLVKK